MQSLLFEHALWSTKDLELLYIYMQVIFYLYFFSVFFSWKNDVAMTKYEL